MPPKYRGIRVIDGGYSDNVPIIDKETVTVSPFSGGADICPLDDKLHMVNISNTIVSVSTDNFLRIASVLLPPDNATLARISQRGYKDALRFLQTRPMKMEKVLNDNINVALEEIMKVNIF